MTSQIRLFACAAQRRSDSRGLYGYYYGYFAAGAETV